MGGEAPPLDRSPDGTGPAAPPVRATAPAAAAVPHVALIGGTSLVGRAVADALERSGARVTRLNRVQEVKAIRRLDAVVHLAGAGVSESRWTDAFKQRLRRSRVADIEALAAAVRSCEVAPAVVVIGSSVAIYGDRGDDTCSDEATRGAGFLADLAADAEAVAAALDGAETRVVSARLGVVLSPEGGYLRQLLLPMKLRMGARIGSGRQYVPWISAPDAARALVHVLTHQECTGAVNVVAPEPVRQADLAACIGRVTGRAARLALPLAPLRRAYGVELVQETLLAGVRAVPEQLLRTGFTFGDADLERTLRRLLG